MTKKIIIALVAVAIIAGGGYVIMKSYSNDSSSTDSAASTENTKSPETQKVSVATITYSSSGFSPSLTTVKSGDTVTITNSSSASLQFDSDPHPDHTDNTELNVGAISAGQSKTFVVTKKGTFGFHNHFKSSDKASIVVE